MICTTFRERSIGASFLVRQMIYHLGAAAVKLVVIVDGNGPLADRELRLCTPRVGTWKEEGWNHEYTSRPCADGIFFMQKISSLWPRALETY